MIEPINRCNLKCATCFSHQGGRLKRDMSLREFKRIIDANASEIKQISLYNYGEPLCNRSIFPMIRYAKENNISFIKIATNGMLLSAKARDKLLRSGLDYLSVSCDGASAKTYEEFRKRGDFKKVLLNLRRLVNERDRQKSRLIIGLQFIIMKHNEGDIKKVLRPSKDLGVDYLRLKKVLVKNERWRHLLPLNPEYNRYSSRAANPKVCSKPAEELAINSDGTVVSCCYIVSGDIKKFNLGNISTATLKQIMEFSMYRDFVSYCALDKSIFSCCAKCQEGNLALDYKVLRLR